MLRQIVSAAMRDPFQLLWLLGKGEEILDVARRACVVCKLVRLVGTDAQMAFSKAVIKRASPKASFASMMPMRIQVWRSFIG